MPKDSSLMLFEPSEAEELLRGWQLHVGRRRVIHEQAARRAQYWHYIVGSIAVVLAGFAGSALVSSWSADSTNDTLALVGGITAAMAAMLSAFQTFLDLGGRAERHRQAATEYKGLLRRFERLSERRAAQSVCGQIDKNALCTLIDSLQTELQTVDAKAPVPPKGLAQHIEGKLPEYVDEALKLGAAAAEI
jgi:hypothetical protein